MRPLAEKSYLRSTVGQPSFYVSLKLAPPGSPRYKVTSELIGAFNGGFLGTKVIAGVLRALIPSAATGINSGGACLGAIFSAWCADWASRKHTIQLGAMVLATGAGLCAGSINVAMFLVARFVAGWGLGMLFTVRYTIYSVFFPPFLPLATICS